MEIELVTPLGFWWRYKKEISDRQPTLKQYANLREDGYPWTKLTAEAAIRAIRSSQLDSITPPLTTSKEYLRVDVIGEQKIDSRWNWLLRIAYEHENEYRYGQWQAELCKLTHVVADLRVLAAYYDSTSQEVEAVLQDRVNLLQMYSSRMTRVPDSKWLFIFGPAGKAKDNGFPFLIYTLEGTAVVRLTDDDPLVPKDWND